MLKFSSYTELKIIQIFNTAFKNLIGIKSFCFLILFQIQLFYFHGIQGVFTANFPRKLHHK